MALLFKYFKVLKDPRTPLPDPDGSLSKVVDRGAIKAGNAESVKADKRVNTKHSLYL